ncbi:hypothetical protein ACLBKS_16295 [Hylemonella sp. W303a]|uniref:hypothetical protein n=1 Tax=Hylemonella sp. W303a TaxID=3389873 RepID=UPI00396B2026
MAADTQATAVLALWNDVDPIHDADYNDWHANEHVPERLTVPGMLWGLRFLATAGVVGPRYLTLYGLRDAQVLDSAPYQHLLAWPTPMSARMRRVMHGISRAVYDVVATQGSLAASGLLLSEDQDLGQPTLNPTPTEGESDAVPGLLRGQRRPDTQPLPWLQTGQSGFQPPESLRLVALAQAPMGAKAPVLPGVSRYRRLPVSGDGQF